MTPTTPGEDALEARLDDFAAAYSAMARFLLAPADAELLTELGRPGLLEAWPMAPDPDTNRGTSLLHASLAAHEPPEALERDYQALFVGPDHLLAPPYESVYRTTDRLLFEGPTFEVRAAYAEFGMQAPKLNQEPDDHAGLEFSFLSLLCGQAIDALRRGAREALDTTLAAQRRFLHEHLLRWGGDCLHLVEENATTAFYRGTGALGLGLLTHAAAAW